MGKQVCIELKNDIAITGTLISVDQYLNIKLVDINVVDTQRHPQLVRECVCVCVLCCLMDLLLICTH